MRRKCFGFFLLLQNSTEPHHVAFISSIGILDDAVQTHKARQANAKIAQQLQERLEENRRVSGQLVQLATSVKVREAIYRSHMEASGGEINPAQQVKTLIRNILPFSVETWKWSWISSGRSHFGFRSSC